MTLNFEEILKIINPTVIPFKLPVYSASGTHIGRDKKMAASLTGTLCHCTFHNNQNMNTFEISVPNIIDSLEVEIFTKETILGKALVKVTRIKEYTVSYKNRKSIGYCQKNIFICEKVSKNKFSFPNCKIPFIKNKNRLLFEIEFQSPPVFFEVRVSCKFIILSKEDVKKLIPVLPKIKAVPRKIAEYDSEEDESDEEPEFDIDEIHTDEELFPMNSVKNASLVTGSLSSIKTVGELKEENDNNTDLKFLTLMESKDYFPSNMELTCLFLTTTTITRMNILFEIMKRLPVGPPLKHGGCYEFVKGFPGILVKRKTLVFLTDYDVVENTDNSVTYLSKKTIETYDMGDCIFDLKFSVDLGDKKPVNTILGVTGNSPYLREKYCVFNREKNYLFETTKHSEMLLLEKEDKFKFEINFTVKERITMPVIVNIEYTEVVLDEKMEENFWDMKHKLRVTKKVDGFLEIRKMDAGELRDAVIVRE